MTVLAKVVDWAQLLDVAWTAALAGIGVAVIFAIAVYGATRSSDMRLAERSAASAAYALLGLAGFLASAGAMVWGILLITSK
jgi:hypothetical protein